MKNVLLFTQFSRQNTKSKFAKFNKRNLDEEFNLHFINGNAIKQAMEIIFFLVNVERYITYVVCSYVCLFSFILTFIDRNEKKTTKLVVACNFRFVLSFV